MDLGVRVKGFGVSGLEVWDIRVSGSDTGFGAISA